MSGPILVTGAGGFVGNHLLDLLGHQPTAVIAWHRPYVTGESRRSTVQWRAVEMLDREAVVRAIADTTPSAVYHLAGAAHVAHSWKQTLQTYQANVLATHHLLSALRQCGIRPRLLVSCSATVYAPQDRPITESDPLAPASPYASSKLAQELLARRAWQEERIPTLIARSFNHIGPGQDSSYVTAGIARQVARIEAGKQEPVLTVGNLEPRRDLTDVRDTVRAYAAMMTTATPGDPYNVCSGRELSIGAVVDTFVGKSRTPIRIVQDPALFRPSDAPMMVGDPTRLSTATGWTPEVPFEQTVDELLDYWRDRIHREP